MKTTMKFTVVLAIMLTSVLGNAKDIKSNVIANNADKTLVFKIDTPIQKSKIEFLDNDENIIYSEYLVNEDSYTKKFDLKNLEVGSYILKIENDLTIVYYDIIIDTDNVEILKKRENNKPVFRKSDDMVYLNLLNLDKEDVEIKVYDSEDRLIHSETFEDTLIVEKAFNFKKALKDNYTIIVSDEENIFYERIIVN